jgi:hypothetical protein
MRLTLGSSNGVQTYQEQQQRQQPQGAHGRLHLAIARVLVSFLFVLGWGEVVVCFGVCDAMFEVLLALVLVAGIMIG